MSINLDGLSAKELQALIAKASQRKKTLAKRKPVAAVRKKLVSLAKAEGYSVDELQRLEQDAFQLIADVDPQRTVSVEAVRMRDAGASVQQIRVRLEELAQNTHGYMIPRDLYYLRNRARTKGDRSVGLLSAALGSALDIKPVLYGHAGNTEPVAKIKGFENAVEQMFKFTGNRVMAGLMTPTVCLSYGGELSEMRALPGYQRLRDICENNKVEVFESVMSLTGMVNVGKGAVVAAFAAPPAPFKPA